MKDKDSPPEAHGLVQKLKNKEKAILNCEHSVGEEEW